MLREIVIEIESAIETRRQGLAVENHSPDERGGAIALILE